MEKGAFTIPRWAMWIRTGTIRACKKCIWKPSSGQWVWWMRMRPRGPFRVNPANSVMPWQTAQVTGDNKDKISALLDDGIVAIVLQTTEVEAQTKCGAR